MAVVQADAAASSGLGAADALLLKPSTGTEASTIRDRHWRNIQSSQMPSMRQAPADADLSTALRGRNTSDATKTLTQFA